MREVNPVPLAAGNLSQDIELHQAIEVALSRSMADEVGINVGETYTLVAAGNRPASLPIRVVGLWEAANAADPAWFFAPDTLRDVLLVDETTYTGPVAATLRGEVGQVVWYARFSGTGLSAAEAAPLLGRVETLRSRMAATLPGVRLDASPEAALKRYRAAADELR